MALSPSIVGQLHVGQPGQPSTGHPGQPSMGQPGQPNTGQPNLGQPNAGQPGVGQGVQSAPGAAPPSSSTYGGYVDPNGAGFAKYSTVLGCWYAWSNSPPWLGYQMVSIPPGSYAQWLGLQAGDVIYFISGSYANPYTGLDNQLYFAPLPHYMWVIDKNTGNAVWMYY